MSFARELLLPRPSLVHRFAIRCTIAVCLLGLMFWTLAQPRYICRGGSKGDVARAAVMQYAHEAYPQWREANPDRLCPSSVGELNQWTNNRDVRDPWGNVYVIRCDASGLAVYSSGEDGVPGNLDDIRSWE